MIDENKILEAMREALHREGTAKAALQALIKELPDWHTLHKDDKDKSILNTMAAIGVSYQSLIAIGDKE